MGNCQHHEHDQRVNGFIDLNGIPYLLGDYLINQRFREVDRSMIRSDIFVNNDEAMRAVIDINIDDIGVRSNNHPCVLGNSTKQNNLLRMIRNNRDYLRHQLPVLKPGIVVRVNYQVESYRTQQVIRTLSEDFVIQDPTYFLDINSSNIDDNAIVVNFMSSLVSTVNEFTHGRDKIQLRITNVQLYYQLVKDNPMKQEAKRFGNRLESNPNDHYPGFSDPFYYHNQMQNVQYIGDVDRGYHKPISELIPPTWSMFNRFYHFDNDGRDLVLHRQEIFDPNTITGLIPCGRVRINRCFIVNPGHRLVFNFSIWKNDVTIVSNTQPVANALEVSFNGCHCYHDNDHINDAFVVDHDHDCGCGCDNNEVDEKQNAAIEMLSRMVRDLYEDMHRPHPEPPRPPVHHCDHSDIDDRLDDIQDKLEAIINSKPPVQQPDEPSHDCGCNHEHTSITVDYVRAMIDEIKNSINKGGNENG